MQDDKQINNRPIFNWIYYHIGGGAPIWKHPFWKHTITQIILKGLSLLVQGICIAILAFSAYYLFLGFLSAGGGEGCVSGEMYPYC